MPSVPCRPGGLSLICKMRCPKCQFDHPLQTTECLKCGIVFSKYKPQVEVPSLAGLSGAVAEQSHAAVLLKTAGEGMATAVISSFTGSLDKVLSDADQSPDAIRKSAATEFKYRLLALPLALLVARLVAGSGLGLAAGLLAMVLHESGHAITAWLTGRWAVPMLWVTMHGEDRSWLVIVAVTGAIGFGGFLAWKARRWGWVCAASAMLIVQLIFLNAPSPGALIIFGGDGGALVLATILMAAFYAPRESALYQSGGLRWGLLTIGALTFMHVFRSWTGPMENIPFGEIEGVNLSDPSLLTEMYGWSVLELVDRYIHLAMVCLGALGVVYAWGLLSGYAEMSCVARHKPPEAAESRD